MELSETPKGHSTEHQKSIPTATTSWETRLDLFYLVSMVLCSVLSSLIFCSDPDFFLPHQLLTIKQNYIAAWWFDPSS